MDELMNVRALVIEYENAGLIPETDARVLVELIDTELERQIDVELEIA